MRGQLVAKIRRDPEGNWLVSFPEIRGAHTYGRSLSQLRRRIPEVLRLWDYDPAHTEIVEILELPKAVKEAIARTVRRRQELEVRIRQVQQDLETTIDDVNPVLRGWGNYFRTGNAARKFQQIDHYVVRRLRGFLVKRQGRNLRAGRAQLWTEDWFNGHGLHRLRGTIRYPEAA